MIDLAEVGAFATTSPDGTPRVRLGLYLPGIRDTDGFEVVVRIIHRDDRFDPAVPPVDVPLTLASAHPLGLWQASVDITRNPANNFGTPGTYLYRYALHALQPDRTKRIVTAWFTDPFARATDVGALSAFTTSGSEAAFAWTDGAWKTPELDDLIAYELHVEEFNDSFDGVIERLDYLKSLGVNVIELMPVTSLKLDFDWGYGPLHYFAPNARWGGAAGLKGLVDAAHAKGVAVILDVVYQHVDPSFPYALVYADAQKASPMIAGNGDFGPTVDFSSAFAQQYVAAVNAYWLDEYHVDGFRYDEVTDLFSSPTDTAYAKIAFDTYNRSLTIARFGNSGYSRIIQVAEALGKARAVLAGTYTNAAWQDDLLNKSEDMAAHGNYVDDGFAHLLDPAFSGYPATKSVVDAAGSPVAMPVAPFQYIETHDHSQLLAFAQDAADSPAFTDRDRFSKVQPFAIALYTSQGVPMLWQGQELAESWTLPGSGRARIAIRRNVHWEYFYDSIGGALIRLYRRLGTLRTQHRSLRSRNSFYYNVQSNPAAGALAYHRLAAADGPNAQEIAMVFLNFSDRAVSLGVPFPAAGRYRELLDDTYRQSDGAPSLDIVVGAAGESHTVSVPSNYGQIFISQ